MLWHFFKSFFKFKDNSLFKMREKREFQYKHLPRGEIKILIVDDEEDVRDILTDFLFSHGFQVLNSKSALEALDILSKEMIHVLITDVHMPGISGDELVYKIKSEGLSEAFCFVMTGELVRDGGNGLREHADVELIKPFKFDEIILKLR